MSFRWRVLDRDELTDAIQKGLPIVRFAKTWRDDGRYVVLEESYGETSAEGASWRPVEVKW
jgi:hypothetical protein